jgi:hypothetical protein
MRWGRMLAVLALVVPALPSHAAQIGPGAKGVCDVKLEGAIAEGDADKLSAALDALPSPSESSRMNVSVCLNSLGGNYDEALKLITLLLKRTNVATVVDRGAQCFSACAFLFMAGNTQKSEDGELGPDRTLDVRGTLGFHAPYLRGAPGPDAAQAMGTVVAQATTENFRRGVGAIASLLEIDRRGLYPRGLLARALQVDPEHLLYVDTIEKAGVWSVKLKGYKVPAALTSHMLDQACRNKDLWTNFSHTVLGRPADDPEELHGTRQSDFPDIRGTNVPIKLVQGKYRETLDMFGYEATNMCIADVFSDGKKRLFLSLSMVPTEQQPPDANQLAQQILTSANDPLTLDVLATPLWYVFSPDTALKSIALP